MKITLEQLTQSRTALDELAVVQRLPIKTAYWIGKLLRKAATELADYDEARAKALKELGATPNEKTRKYDFPNTKAEDAFVEQHKELVASEVDFGNIEPMKLEQFGETSISAGALSRLDWLIIE